MTSMNDDSVPFWRITTSVIMPSTAGQTYGGTTDSRSEMMVFWKVSPKKAMAEKSAMIMGITATKTR